VPFVVDAVSFTASSALIAAIPGRFASERPAGTGRSSLRADIAQGVAWLVSHRLLRTIVVMNGVTNLALTAGDAILVLLAQRQLGLGSVGYGLLLASYAVGGLLGSLLAVRVGRWLGTGTIIVGGVLVAVEGFALTIDNVVGVSLRRAIVPDALMGRVVATSWLVTLRTMPAGGVLGGVLGRTLGLRAIPVWRRGPRGDRAAGAAAGQQPHRPRRPRRRGPGFVGW
jgi:hypothetical protein